MIPLLDGSGIFVARVYHIFLNRDTCVSLIAHGSREVLEARGSINEDPIGLQNPQVLNSRKDLAKSAARPCFSRSATRRALFT